MNRRNFFNRMFTTSFGVGLGSISLWGNNAFKKRNNFQLGTLSVDNNKISYFIDGLTAPIKIIHISDTHLSMDDIRGEPYKQYSQRMARAYNTTRHFSTGEVTNPVKSFEEVLDLAVKKKTDLLAMTGDIFNFPSEAAIEWVHEKLKNAGIHYLYVAGNHDWHYEGMEGSSKQLRDIWTKKRLYPLYQGNDPLMASYELKDIIVLAIDDSTYEIMPEQLEFFKKYANGDKPIILMMHIPLYAPGRSMGYGCGNPSWGAENDTLYKTERRERWPKEGHTKITMDFYDEVFSATNLLGIFVGHVHGHQPYRLGIDLIKGIPQFFVSANAIGAFLEIDFLPLVERDRILLVNPVSLGT